MDMEKLTIEINEQFVRTNDIIPLAENVGMMVTPLTLDEKYWIFRVKLYEDQAIIGFPKFTTIAIGFAQEDDWNTNLPYILPAEQIYNHIAHNKKYNQIPDDKCLEAIRLIQKTIADIERGKA
ncbi:MAG: hypothetical protein AUF65_00870 [Chloroflexi bacterium 13_1_20CM_50_12]|nr:MAG: hypothetical protein AUF65_00870 [Chloroflexi bacterium 13_1_20CM_50_12]